jgi:hypothetical protein
MKPSVVFLTTFVIFGFVCLGVYFSLKYIPETPSTNLNPNSNLKIVPNFELDKSLMNMGYVNKVCKNHNRFTRFY